MQWQTHGRRAVYESEWVNLWLDDVEVPGGSRFEHHVLRFPRHSTTSLVVRDDEVLMIWRHRFIPDAWGWEVPAGWSDPGEDPETAIRREIEEETGWRPSTIKKLTEYNAISGIGDMRFSLFLGEGAEHVGDPSDVAESDLVAWKSLAEIRDMVTEGSIADGPSLTAILYLLAMLK